MNRDKRNTKIVGKVARSRSALMARIKNKNTRPELVVRREAHALGFRFRLHQKRLPGSPDLTFPRLRKVIFVHGCFWHRHQGCKRTTTPKTRVKYWKEKFRKNVERDASVIRRTSEAGWGYLVVWECETIDLLCLKKNLMHFLGKRRSP